MRRFAFALVCATVVNLVAAQAQSVTKAQKEELAQYFGFGEMQIYRLKPGISDLRLADLNGDGRTDIVLWNSQQSRFELFFQPDPDAPREPDTETLERNELPSQGNMVRKNVAVAYRVAATEVADLTGDRRPDLVFFGEPKEVVILPGKPDGTFGEAVSVRAPEGDARGGVLAVGDYDHDGRTDVALLGKDVLQIFPQKPEGGLGKPVRIVHGIRSPTLLLTADFNGDGRDDLAIGADDEEYAVYVCLQDERGALSAMQRLRVPRLRSMTFAAGGRGHELYAIQEATGHLKQYAWEVPAETGGAPDWPQRIYSYPVKVKSKRLPLTMGDLTGDGLVDVVAADPDAAQLILFKGTPAGLSASTAFPGLMKTVDLLIADLTGDGRNELISVSAEEKTVGVSDYQDGRVTFPRPLAIQGEPLAVAVGPLQAGDNTKCVAYLTRSTAGGAARREPPAAEEEEAEEEEGAEEATTGGTGLMIRLVDPATQRELRSWECGELRDPAGIRLADVNQDGRGDLIVFSRFAAPRVFLQKPDGSFGVFSGPETREGLIGAARLESFCLADVTGDGLPEVLTAQKSLARALRVQDGRWTVVDQYNPETADAEITGLAALPGEPGHPTLVMYDRKARDLLVLKRRPDNTYAVAQTMPIGNFDLSAMTALPVGPERRPALLLADAVRMALFTPGEVAATLVARQSYETDVKDASLGDAVIGDLNHDGVRDVVVVDMRKAALEILTTLPDGEFVRATRFQVFQGKRFRDDPRAYGEPRQVLMGDVTGDKIDDIVLIVHDRLIVYPGQ